MNAPTRYVDDSVKGFITWSIIWGSVAVLVGILISLQLAWPGLNVAPYLTYGRLRPIDKGGSRADLVRDLLGAYS